MCFDDKFRAALVKLEAQGRWREMRTEMGVSFSHNDYLGIAAHPRVVEAGVRALQEHGAGSRGSRLLGGNTTAHEAIEEKIARHFQAPAALFFSTGYLANLAVLTALAPFVDTVVSDERNHASLIDGIRLGAGAKQILSHQRWDDIPKSLDDKKLLLVAESLYSMDGDLVDPSLRRQWEARDAFLVVDESHAGGVFLEEGLGLSHRWGNWERRAAVVTFGKAFGVAGAAVLGSRALRDLLVNTARSFIYTTAPPPAVCAMVGAALDVSTSEPERRRTLWHRAASLRSRLRAAGAPIPPAGDLWSERSPLVPFLIPGDDNALRIAQSMQDFGWNLRAIRYPTVARGSERLRLSLSLDTTEEDTERMAEELVRRWRRWQPKEFTSRESTRA